MGAILDHVIYRAALEIRYDEGIVYLDRCGSLTNALQRVLGEPFRNTIAPTVEHGQFASLMENLTVQYGPAALVVDQTWLETFVRFEKIAPIAWGEVADRLEVEGKVTRFGLRTWIMWRTKDPEDGQRIVAGSKLVRETPRWTELVGAPSALALETVSKTKNGFLRAKLNTVEMKVEGRFRSEDEKFIFSHAVQLDLDHYQGSVSGAFSKEKLQAFLRFAIEGSKRLTEGFSKELFHGD